jgi:nitrite reductase (cytochrome c-552)
MKKYTTIILSAVIIILAAILVGILIFLKNQPVQVRATEPIVKVNAFEPVSSIWGRNFPNEYDSMLKTKLNTEDTEFGGSSKFSWLERDPRQLVLFAGYAFSKGYNDDRGHEWSLEDVRTTKRVTDKTTGSCYSCKSSNNPAIWNMIGLEEFSKMPFAELGKQIDQPIGCANCHEAGTMRLIVTNPAVINGFEAQGIDWTKFTRQEMRTVVCANCHDEYYMAGENKVLTMPWKNGTKIDEILAYYEENQFKDWEYPEAGTPMLKAQHPDFETYTANSTHFKAGVACADCHMPYVRDGSAKYSMHDIHSPLLNAELACGACHTDVGYVVARVSEIQEQVSKTKISTEDAIIDAITAIKSAAANTSSDPVLLDEARALHRKAQFMWDFVSAENSMGFHNPEYTLKILADSTNFARQAQMLAAQAANDPSLLIIGVYDKGNPPAQ